MKNQKIYFELNFSTLALITVSFPLFGLIICFVSSVITQFGYINEIVCGVHNFIPSISAITGTAPQRYIWRIFIALHAAPRFLNAALHLNFYLKHTEKVKWRSAYKVLVYITFIINVIENLCLICVSYISSIDNYPLHEKIFITFMVTSCVYMAQTLFLYRITHGPQNLWTDMEQTSYKFKRGFFAGIMACTCGLVWFILKHRLWCTPNAFSWFSLCEYGIGMSNMGFNLSAALDFREVKLCLVANDEAETSCRGFASNGATVRDSNGTGYQKKLF